MSISHRSKLTRLNKLKNNSKTLKKITIGAHASITPTIFAGLQYIRSIGGNAAQIYFGAPRKGSIKDKQNLGPDDIKNISTYLKKEKMELVIHSIYLLNFANHLPTDPKNYFAHLNLQYDLKYAAKLGAHCVVLHFGYKKKDRELKQALDIMIANINYILARAPHNITLALETSACKSQVGSTLENIKYIWDGIYNKYKATKRVGICIDTAHVFASGDGDISTVSGMRTYLERFNKLIGVKNIANFHLNDSRWELNSNRDEHRGITHGEIFKGSEGLAALKYLIQYCTDKKHKIIIILETHGAGGAGGELNSSLSEKQLAKKLAKNPIGSNYESEIALIKSLVAK
jgi:apurinic endonuclease APN1